VSLRDKEHLKGATSGALVDLRGLATTMAKGAPGQGKMCGHCGGRTKHNKSTCPFKSKSAEEARKAREELEARKARQLQEAAAGRAPQAGRAGEAQNLENDPSRLRAGAGQVNAFNVMGEASQQAHARTQAQQAQEAQAAKKIGGGGGGEGLVKDSGGLDAADGEDGCAVKVVNYILMVIATIHAYVTKTNEWMKDPLLGKPRSIVFEPPDASMSTLETVPASLCKPTLWYWDPWTWAREQCGKAPHCPCCGDDKVLNSKGFTYKRALMLGMENTYVVARRFECHGCKGAKEKANGEKCATKTFFGWDPEIVCNLPCGVRDMFKWRLEHRALVDFRLIEELMFSTDHGMTANTFAEMVKERAVAVFLRLELGWKQRLAAHKEARIPPFQGAEGPQISDMPEFDSKFGYNGWAPGAGFWRNIADAVNSEKLEVREKQMSMSGGQILHADHVRKPAKVIKLGHDRIYKGFYNVTNEHGQIIGVYFTQTEALSELEEALKALNNRYLIHGHPHIELFYTDKCCQDRALLKKFFPSLNADGSGACFTDSTFLSLEDLGMTVVYVKNAATANQLCATILEELRSDQWNGVRRVGFDVEWTPPVMCTRVGDGLVATIQIAFCKNAYVFHVSQMTMKAVPERLKELLEDPEIRLCGLNIDGDRAHIQKKGVTLPPECLEDVGRDAAKLGLVVRQPSLGGVVQALFKRPMDKGRHLAMSNWDMKTLTEPLIRYAALDAAAGLAIAKCLDPVKDLASIRLRKGDPIVLMDTSGKKELAYGKLEENLGPGPHSALLHVRVGVNQVVTPGVKLTVANRQDYPSSENAPRTLGELRDRANTYQSAGSGDGAPFTVKWCALQIKPKLLKSEIASVIRERGLQNIPPIPEHDELEAPAPESVAVGDWTRERVKLDPFHGMQRVGETVAKAHSFRQLFFRQWRDAWFAIDTKERETWEEAQKTKLLNEGITSENEVKARLAYRYRMMLSQTPRKIPPPEELKESCRAVYHLFGNRIDKKRGSAPLFKQSTWEAVENLEKHFDAGCVSDKPGVELYYTSPHGRGDHLYNARGTNTNEGMHRHQAKVLRLSPTRSPTSAMGAIMAHAHRWNLKRGITRRGDKDFGSVDTGTLLAIKDADRKLDIPNGKYASVQDHNEFLPTNESFCIMKAEIKAQCRAVASGPAHDLEGGSGSGSEWESESESETSSVIEGDRGYAFHITEAEKRFYERQGLVPGASLMAPCQPTVDERNLYKKLLPQSLSSGCFNVRKMQGLWDQEVAANAAKPQESSLRLGAATPLSLEKLRERMEHNDAVQQSRAEIGADSDALQQRLRGSREGVSFAPVPAATPSPLHPPLVPSPAALNSSWMPMQFPFTPPVHGSHLLQLVPPNYPTNPAAPPQPKAKTRRAPKLCSVCGHAKWSAEWRGYHGSAARLHLDGCTSPATCKGCNLSFCTVPERDRLHVCKRKHKKRRCEEV